MCTSQSSPTYCHFWMCKISSVGFADEAHERSVLINSFILNDNYLIKHYYTRIIENFPSMVAFYWSKA